MSLIKCKECENKISDKSDVCPFCGMPQEETIYYDYTFAKEGRCVIGSKVWLIRDAPCKYSSILSVRRDSDREILIYTKFHDTPYLITAKKEEVYEMNKFFAAAIKCFKERG